MLPHVSDIDWPCTFRLIPSQYAAIPFFEQVSDPEDWEDLLEVASLTDPAIRQAVGEISLVPKAQRLSSPGATWVMSAFTHPNPQGSRFSKGAYGVYYAADSFEGALAEVLYHRGRFHAATQDKANNFVLRCLICTVRGSLHDLRIDRVRKQVLSAWPTIYDKDDYRQGQRLGNLLHGQGSQGIVYTSVRLSTASCVALFQPTLITPPVDPEQYVIYHWDGQTTDRYLDCRGQTWQPAP